MFSKEFRVRGDRRDCVGRTHVVGPGLRGRHHHTLRAQRQCAEELPELYEGPRCEIDAAEKPRRSTRQWERASDRWLYAADRRERPQRGLPGWWSWGWETEGRVHQEVERRPEGMLRQTSLVRSWWCERPELPGLPGLPELPLRPWRQSSDKRRAPEPRPERHHVPGGEQDLRRAVASGGHPGIELERIELDMISGNWQALL